MCSPCLRASASAPPPEAVSVFAAQPTLSLASSALPGGVPKAASAQSGPAQEALALGGLSPDESALKPMHLTFGPGSPVAGAACAAGTAAATPGGIEVKLEKLQRIFARGYITADEHAAQKARLLNML